MTPAQITGSTFRGGLLRGAVAGAVALLVVYGVLFFTSSEQTATATAPCEQGTVVASPADNPGLVADCEVLLAAKDTLRGTETLNWSATLAIGNWEGITVSGTPGRVTELDIDGWTSEWTLGRDIVLNGSLPAGLGGLSKLRRLTLPRNALTGTIPPELGNLSELTDLHLYGNRLTSAIPPELGRLSDLMRLDLSRNRLTGGIPVELGRLSDLMSLRLHNNRLTGAIPASLGDPTGLNQLNLAGNAFTGCIPASLRGTTLNDLSSLSLSYCTTTTTYTLTTSVTGNGRTSPLAGAYSYLSGASVTVTATPDAGWQVASWSGDCTASGTTATCALTMSANKAASVTFERITYTLTVTAGAGGSVSPSGTTTRYEGDEVTFTASWNDATHTFTGWGGDCAGTATTCVLTMDAAKTVTATFAALAADRCATTAAADCIRAVYKGAPDDYAQVTDIPADLLLTAAADGRFYLERGQQYTVVTAARLPTGWTRFYLERSPLGTPSPVSAARLIPPVGTTYTFTVTEDEAATTLITYDLKRARPFVRPRPDGKPEIGDTVVTTVFSVEADTLSYSTYDSTGAVSTAGSYAFLSDPDDMTTAVTTYEALRDGTTTALLIHKSDAHGASQAALYDSVETGHLIEWSKADDCFVRYRVTDAPEPSATATHREFGVRWETYVFQGCQTGSMPTSSKVTFSAAAELPLDHLGGTRLTDYAVVHGQWQLAPTAPRVPGMRSQERGDVATQPLSYPPLTGRRLGEAERRRRPLTTADLTVARLLSAWREPSIHALPVGWTFSKVLSGTAIDIGFAGYEAAWSSADGGQMLRVRAYYSHPDNRRPASVSSYTTTDGKLIVRELFVIAGRPATVTYSPHGPQHKDTAVKVQVFDLATETTYEVQGSGADYSGGETAAARVAAIACSLFLTVSECSAP